MKNLLFPLFILAMLFGCKSDPAVQRTEIGDFEYTHHIKNKGPKPEPGQLVFYNYHITKGGRVVQSNFGEAPSGGLMPSKEDATANPQAIGEALRMMAVGDSVTIIYPQANPDSNMVYQVVLRAIHDASSKLNLEQR